MENSRPASRDGRTLTVTDRHGSFPTPSEIVEVDYLDTRNAHDGCEAVLEADDGGITRRDWKCSRYRRHGPCANVNRDGGPATSKELASVTDDHLVVADVR